MKTIIALGNNQLGDRHFKHGEEIPPETLDGEVLEWWLDHKWCMESLDRRSLYRLFSAFSGCAESEELTEQECASLCVAGLI
jgi:hypothetical protein